MTPVVTDAEEVKLLIGVVVGNPEVVELLTPTIPVNVAVELDPTSVSVASVGPAEISTVTAADTF